MFLAPLISPFVLPFSVVYHKSTLHYSRQKCWSPIISISNPFIFRHAHPKFRPCQHLLLLPHFSKQSPNWSPSFQCILLTADRVIIPKRQITSHHSRANNALATSCYADIQHTYLTQSIGHWWPGSFNMHPSWGHVFLGSLQSSNVIFFQNTPSLFALCLISAILTQPTHPHSSVSLPQNGFPNKSHLN